MSADDDTQLQLLVDDFFIVYIVYRQSLNNCNVVNPVKYFFLLYNTNKVVVTIDGHATQRIKVVKYLGLHIDDGLSWSYHVNQITKICGQRFGILKRANLPTFVLPLYYNA